MAKSAVVLLCASLLMASGCAHGTGSRQARFHEAAEVDLPLSEMRALVESKLECNGNSYDDSLDVAKGYEDDLNANHEIDRCEGDTLLCFGLAFPSCRQRAREADTLYLYRTFAGNQSVFIEYYIPSSGGRFRLDIRRPQSHVIKTLADSSGAGVFRARWDLRDAKGAAVRNRRVYTVELTWNGRHIARKVYWRS